MFSAVGVPQVDAVGEMRAGYRARSQSSKPQVVMAQVVVAPAA
jgi:hypothetical protein